MLVLFKVKNYTSFKKESILDMRATAYTQHPTHVVRNNNVSLLKTAAIYGANASGKSNLISAMFEFRYYVTAQFISHTEDIMTENKPMSVGLFEPFMLSNCETKPTEFEIVFVRNNRQFQYGFEVLRGIVLNEWYYIDDKKVFERKNSDISYGSLYTKKISSFNKVPEKRLYLAILEYFLEGEDRDLIITDIIDFLKNDFDVHFEVSLETSIKSFGGSASVSKVLLNDSEVKDLVESYLSKIDVGIKKLRVKEIEQERDGKIVKRKILRTVHDVYGDNKSPVSEVEFDLSKESSGTLRFLAYIQSIVLLVKKGGVFIVDEMSARLHPLLTKLIVDLFQDSNNTKAQLIFTTHDISILNHKQFRRDEVIFVDKNERGESAIYSLSDLKIREDATFSKDYLQGKYGAIPIFNYNKLFDED